jgi:hypothetical protein
MWLVANIDRIEEPFNVGVRNAAGYRPIWHMWSLQPGLGMGFEVTFSR